MKHKCTDLIAKLDLLVLQPEYNEQTKVSGDSCYN